MKDDERQFLKQCQERTGLAGQCKVSEGHIVNPRFLINEEGFPIPYKRALYLLGKWCDKGWYQYGVSLDLGWLTQEGTEVQT